MSEDEDGKVKKVKRSSSETSSVDQKKERREKVKQALKTGYTVMEKIISKIIMHWRKNGFVN